MIGASFLVLNAGKISGVRRGGVVLLAHSDLCGAILRHRGRIGCFKLKLELVTIPPIAAGDDLAYAQRGSGGAGKLVGKGHAAFGRLLVQLYPLLGVVIPLEVGRRSFQRGGAVVINNGKLNLDQVALSAVFDIGLLVVDLGKLIVIGLAGVSAVIIVDLKRDTARIIAGSCCGIRHRGCGGIRQGMFFLVHLRSFQLKVELVIFLRQAGVCITYVYVILNGFQREILILGGKGVGKSSHLGRGIVRGPLHGTGDFQGTVLVIGDGNSYLVVRIVVRNTEDTVRGDDFVDVINVGAGLTVLDVAEVERHCGSSRETFRIL